MESSTSRKVALKLLAKAKKAEERKDKKGTHKWVRVDQNTKKYVRKETNYTTN